MHFRLNSTPNAQITTAADDTQKYFFIVFHTKKDLIFHVNPLPSHIKPYVLRKIKFNSHDENNHLFEKTLKLLLNELKLEMSLKIWRSMTYPICHTRMQMTSYIYYRNNDDVILNPK